MFTSIGGPLILQFVSSGHMLILVKAFDFSFLLYVVYCCHCGAIGYLLSCWVICDINGVNPGYIVKAVVNCAIICNTNTAFG